MWFYIHLLWLLSPLCLSSPRLSYFLLFSLCLSKINGWIPMLIGYKCVAFLGLVNYFR